MPDMDGYEFISKIKDKKIPSQMALMTGLATTPDTLVKIYKTIRYPVYSNHLTEPKSPKRQNAWDAYQDLQSDNEQPPTQKDKDNTASD